MGVSATNLGSMQPAALYPVMTLAGQYLVDRETYGVQCWRIGRELMPERMTTPNGEVYSSMTDACLNSDDLEVTMQFLPELRKQSPGHTWSTSIFAKCLAKRKKQGRHMELYDQLSSERRLLGGQQNMYRPMRLGLADGSPRKSWKAASVRRPLGGLPLGRSVVGRAPVKSAAVYSESAVVMLRLWRGWAEPAQRES